MVIPYQKQTALYIFKPQFNFLVYQLGHSFTIIGYEATQELHIQILLVFTYLLTYLLTYYLGQKNCTPYDRVE
jgi:hypothetical protein